MKTLVAAPAAGGLRLTHLDKPLWPPAPGSARPPVTKGDLLAYLQAVAPFALPHLRGRPLVLTRYPHGAEGKSFYQKNLPPGAPDWLPRFRYRHHGGREIAYLVPSSVADLCWVGQQAALEFHPWLSVTATPEWPDRAVIDLDPMPPAGFEQARATAALVARLLLRAGVRGWLKTSGATGLHIFVPIRPGAPYPLVAEAMRAVGEALDALAPGTITLERPVARRAGRVYVDFLQNGLGKTLCAAYSPRPLPGAPVSMPLRWAELQTVQPMDWTIRTVPQRLARVGDAWADLLQAPPQDLQALVAAAAAVTREPRT